MNDTVMVRLGKDCHMGGIVKKIEKNTVFVLLINGDYVPVNIEKVKKTTHAVVDAWIRRNIKNQK